MHWTRARTVRQAAPPTLDIESFVCVVPVEGLQGRWPNCRRPAVVFVGLGVSDGRTLKSISAVEEKWAKREDHIA